MLALFAATIFTYTFPVDAPAVYDVQVSFDGYLPLFGGREGKLKVTMAVEAKGVAPEQETAPANLRVNHRITELAMTLNDAKLPFGLSNVEQFFPATTSEVSPFGKIAKTNAPDVKMPVTLPGLDSKRFADLTYLPVEFPDSGVELGKPFTFAKKFSDGTVQYTATPSKIDEDQIELLIRVAQSSTAWEDTSHSGLEVPKSGEAPTGAAFKVQTELSGTGSVVFDRHRNVVRTVAIDLQAKGVVTTLKSGDTSSRNVTTILRTKVR